MFEFKGDYLSANAKSETPNRINARSMTAQGIPHRAGDVLPNGAVILDEIVIRTFDYRRDSIVLAMTNSRHSPFVTWHRFITSDSPTRDGMYVIVDSCAFGEYHREIEDAVEAFQKRVTDKLDMLGMQTDADTAAGL